MTIKMLRPFLFLFGMIMIIPQQPVAEITLESNHAPLVEAFTWAKGLMKKYEQETVGTAMYPAYKCTYPHKNAFCSRDFSHQALGAHMLGWTKHNKNMMFQFARSTPRSKNINCDWSTACTGGFPDTCSKPKYLASWHICYNGDLDSYDHRVGPFDLCAQVDDLYDWTGDSTYFTDPQMREFFVMTLDSAVRLWNREAISDSVVDGTHSTYCEKAGYVEPAEAADMLAVQYAGYKSYARLYRFLNKQDSAAVWERKAAFLQNVYQTKWWNGSIFCTGLADGSYIWAYGQEPSWFPLKEQMIADTAKANKQLEFILKNIDRDDTEPTTYHCDVLYPYGLVDKGWDELMLLRNVSRGQPNTYPEVPFTFVKHSVQWLLGVTPEAAIHAVTTINNLPSHKGNLQVKIREIPLGVHKITLEHKRSAPDTQSTTFSNDSGNIAIEWEAAFRGLWNLKIDGTVQKTYQRFMHGKVISYVKVQVAPGKTTTVAIAGPASVVNVKEQFSKSVTKIQQRYLFNQKGLVVTQFSNNGTSPVYYNLSGKKITSPAKMKLELRKGLKAL